MTFYPTRVVASEPRKHHPVKVRPAMQAGGEAEQPEGPR